MLVHKRVRKVSLQELAEALCNADMGPRTVQLSSRNVLRYKCSVTCDECNSAIATVDNNIESTVALPKHA